MEIHREIQEKYHNTSYSTAITQKRENGFPGQGWENRLALPEQFLAPVDLNIVIRTFSHHKAIFREVVNQFGLNTIPMLLSEGLAGHLPRIYALISCPPASSTFSSDQPNSPTVSEQFSDRPFPTLRRTSSNSPPYFDASTAESLVKYGGESYQARRRVASVKAESVAARAQRHYRYALQPHFPTVFRARKNLFLPSESRRGQTGPVPMRFLSRRGEE